MIGSVAVITWLVAMPHAPEMIWVCAAAGGSLYALVALLLWVSSRGRAARHHAAWGGDDVVPALPNPVNTTSDQDQPFAAVGASSRWPAVWIGQAVCPPAARRPSATAARGQRRRLSVRSVVSMTHQKGRK